MKNNISKFLLTSFCCLFFSVFSYSQDSSLPAKLVYTIHVEGLTSIDQVSRLDKDFKQKVGIYSGEINFESKTIIVKTIEDITYQNVSDILLKEGLKSQNYSVTKE
jgi:hypothetical protein